MSMLITLALVAAAVQVLGGGIYIRDTLKGRTQPNRVTWFLWGAAPMIATAIVFGEGRASWATLPVFMAGVVPFLTVVASYFNPRAYWRLGAFDYACGALGLASLVVWLAAEEPVTAFVMLVVTDGLAALPTIRKAWSHPETETSAAYYAAMFSGAAGLANVAEWTVLQYSFPIYLVAVNVVILYAIHRRRRPGA
jgi:hypothetical protein